MWKTKNGQGVQWIPYDVRENLVCVKTPEDDAWEASKRVERDIKKVLKSVVNCWW
jgi:hypothetical protein